MRRRDGLAAVAAAAASLLGGRVAAQSPAPPSPQGTPGPFVPPVDGAARARRAAGKLESLGQERYRIGAIVVDKRAGSFTVPGRVHKKNVPLEYLATSPGGMKEYETLFELDAVGSEFNLACILIGLEADPNLPWRELRIARKVSGPRVTIDVAWGEGDQRQRLPAALALLNPEAGVAPEGVEWVYIGSPSSAAVGRFAADDTGTLIGFVSDANSIIEAAAPIGIGAYGSVRGSPRLPAVGTPIELVVAAARPAK
ncbi:MAG: hypothetical protein AMXMBFR66_16690 [Pseudomonadota bacterium]